MQEFLCQVRHNRASVAAYGAAAKVTMLLNATGAGLSDRRAARPEFLLILPWNIAHEIMRSTRFIGDGGGWFVISSLDLRVIAA